MAANSQKTAIPASRADHLKPYRWEKGQSGNISGRPVKKPITEYYSERVTEPLPEPIRRKLKLKKGATYGEALSLSLFMQAIKGKVAAAKEITDRIEGRPLQGLRIERDDGGPVQIEEMTTEEVDRRIAELEERILQRKG